MIDETNWLQRTVRWTLISLYGLIAIPLFAYWLLNLPVAVSEIDAGYRRVLHAYRVASANE